MEFFKELDRHTPRFLEIFKSKGKQWVLGISTAALKKACACIATTRVVSYCCASCGDARTVERSLQEDLIKHYKQHRLSEGPGAAHYGSVCHSEGLQEPPEDIAIVIEGGQGQGSRLPSPGCGGPNFWAHQCRVPAAVSGQRRVPAATPVPQPTPVPAASPVPQPMSVPAAVPKPMPHPCRSSCCRSLRRPSSLQKHASCTLQRPSSCPSPFFCGPICFLCPVGTLADPCSTCSVVLADPCSTVSGLDASGSRPRAPFGTASNSPEQNPVSRK
ncbi:hypothetical protein EYF80_014137 [Liparis tanakae]|uniref:Uncharacterized protein n=1 Tax=Liparis tanakae TaxID=230148 RepID=A0A4Z2ICG6_9TELE|nr:hypothetical protein EYF80_014137 [Liparis tanakae]